MKQTKQKSLQKRFITGQSRRQVLWNVLQPGDPYDIKKSMIAKLPQHPPRFMGQNLPLVCLFQAAEIQRLTEFLEQMTLKIRQVERVQLDRHSYEVQIKQLAQKLILFGGYKIQNDKLKQFIKRQSQQMQYLQKHRNLSHNLIEIQSKYESVLNQLRISRQNHALLQKSNSDLLKEVTEWRYKSEKNQKLLSQQRLRVDHQIKIRIQTALSQYRVSFQSRQYQLKGQINVVKENLALKNRQIDIQKGKISQISKQLTQKQHQLGKYIRGQVQTQSTKTQELLKISKRLQQTTYYLEQSEKQALSLKQEISYLNKKVKTLEEEAKRKQMNRQEQTKNQELRIVISQMEVKLRTLTMEIERLNAVIDRKSRQFEEKNMQVHFLKQKLLKCERTAQALENQLKQNDAKIKRIELEFRIFEDKDTKIQTMARQIARLNMVLESKVSEVSHWEHKFRQYTQSQGHANTILRSRQEAIRILESRLKDYETKIMSIEQANKLSFQEINRLNLKLVNTQNQNIHVRRQLGATKQSSFQGEQLKNQVSRLNQEINIKVVQNRKLREDNEQMFRQITDLQFKSKSLQAKFNEQNLTFNELKKMELKNLESNFNQKERSYLQKIDMYQKSMPKLSKQIERLQQLLQKKQTELMSLQQDLDIERQKIRMIQKKSSSQYEMSALQFQKKISFLQAKCNSLQRANQQLTQQRGQISSKIESLQFKLHESYQQFQRLKSTLKLKENSFQEYERRSSMLQNTINRQQEQNMNLRNESLRNRQQLESNLQIMKNLQFEIDKSRRDTGLLKMDVSQHKNQISNLRQQNNRLSSRLNQKQSQTPQIFLLKQTIQALRNDLNLSNNEKQQVIFQLNNLKKRNQLLQQSLKSSNSKINEYQQNIRHVQQANLIKIDDSRQRIINEYENKLREANTRYNQLIQSYNSLMQKCDELEQGYGELEQKYGQMQLQRQNQAEQYQGRLSHLQNTQNQNKQLRMHLSQYQQKIFSYEEKVALLSQEIERLNQNIQQLKLKLNNSVKNQQSHAIIDRITLQLEQTKIQLTNLKTMLQQYESINEHALGQRDELFKITHEQQEESIRLKNQISNLSQYRNSALKDNQNQTRTLKDQYHAISVKYATLQSQLTNVQNQNSNLHSQYSSLQGQLSTLQSQYSLKVSQLQAVRREVVDNRTLQEYELRFKQYEIRIHTITQQYESAIRLQRQKVIEYLQNIQKQARALSIMEQNNKELFNRIRQLQTQITQQKHLISEMQQVKTEYINTKMENQELNRLLEEMQEQLFEARQQLKLKNTQQHQNYLTLKQENLRISNQNNRLRVMSEQQRQKIVSLERNINAVLSQKQALNLQAHKRLNQLESQYVSVQQQNNTLRQNIDQLHVQITQVSIYQEISAEWESKYNNLYQAYNETYTIYNDLKVQYENMKQSLRIYTQVKVPQLQHQFAKLNSALVQIRSEKQALTRNLYQQQQLLNKNLQLQKAIDRLQSINKSLNQQISETRLRLSNENSLQRRIEQQLTLFVVLFAEIETLRKRLHQSQNQCDDVRRNSLSPYRVKK